MKTKKGVVVQRINFRCCRCGRRIRLLRRKKLLRSDGTPHHFFSRKCGGLCQGDRFQYIPDGADANQNITTTTIKYF